MRKSLWLVVVAATLVLPGCDGLRDAFSAQPDVVASAAGRRLSTERMLGLMQAVPQGTVTREGAEFVANLWIDLQLFARSRVTGQLESDSVAVSRVMWPQITQARLGAWRDTLSTRRPVITEAAADSAYEAGELRLFQHILVLPAGSSARDTAAAREKIGGMLARIRRGSAFTEFTAQNNDATKDDLGFLGVGGRGRFVPEFETAAWSLEPGQVSDVVQSPWGFHIIRRAPKAEALPRFLDYIQGSSGVAADSAYVANLAAARGLEVRTGVGEAVKDALADLPSARGSRKTLASYHRGGFTVGDFARWMEMLPPGAGAQIMAQPDSFIVDFVKQLAQNQLVMEDVDSAEIAIPVADWQAMQISFQATVEQLAAAVGLKDSAVTDSTLPQPARLDSAASRVERFLDRLVMGQAQFRPLQPSLSAYLREQPGASYRVNQAGLNRVMELYTAQRTADSVEAAQQGKAPAGAEPGVIQPAPGPPPVPGDTNR